jgi:hypothetical protein
MKHGFSLLFTLPHLGYGSYDFTHASQPPEGGHPHLSPAFQFSSGNWLRHILEV